MGVVSIQATVKAVDMQTRTVTLVDPQGEIKTLKVGDQVQNSVATAIGLFGFNSGAALATVVGVLVEVPVMLSVVRITTATKDWYERVA